MAIQKYVWQNGILLFMAALSATVGCTLKTGDKIAQDAVESSTTQPPAESAVEETPKKEASQLRLMQFSLIFLNARYVEPSRINWQKMTVYGVDALQNMVPEVVARFDKRIDDSPTKIDLHVGDVSREFPIAQIKSLSQAYRTSEDIYNFVLDNMSTPKDTDEMEYAMINGMFSTLDPHTNLLPPYMFEDVMMGNGGFAGCGFVVGVRDDNLTIISPMEGTPAWRAGLKPGDIVVRIDDESTENMPLQDAVDRMRGEEGSKVTLYIRRKGWAEVKPFVITREVIQIKSVTSHALTKDGIGYLKLKSFDQTTALEVKKHLGSLHEALPQMRGLIIDLRNNSGGLLSQSTDIAELFLKRDDTIVTVEGSTKSDRETTRARWDGSERDYPIAVLINEGSASASEIVSGALQQNQRAVVIGERSFGKGSVQILKDNPDGSAIKVTSAQYLTPGDISIQGVGIVPDIELTPSFIDKDSGVSLIETQNIRREDTLEQTLHSSKTTQRESMESLHFLYHPMKEDEERAKAIGITTHDLRSVEDYSEDSEIRFAIEFLKNATSVQREEMLEQSKPFLAQHAADYRKDVINTFKDLGIDWSEGSDDCKSLTWGISSGNEEATDGGTIKLDADGSEKTLKMWVKNTCETGDITQLLANLKSNDEMLDEREFVFGRIKPGETREWTVKLKVPRSMSSRDDNVEIQFHSGSQLQPMGLSGSFTSSIRSTPRPRFAYTYWIDDVIRGNADGKLSRGESVDMYVWIKNVGETEANKVSIHIANESGSGVFLQQGRASIEKLAPGQHQLALLKFDVSKERPQKPPSKRIKRDRIFNPDEAVLQLSIEDDAYDIRVEQPLIFPVIPEIVQPVEFTSSTKTLTKGSKIGQITANAELEKDAPAEIRIYADNHTAICWKQAELSPCALLLSPATDDATPQDTPLPVLPVFTHEAPQILFNSDLHTVNADQATLSVKLTDNDMLKDYEVYMWTHDGLKLKAEKLDYGLISGRDKQIDLKLPLKSGDNTVVFVARDTQDAETVEFFHINKH